MAKFVVEGISLLRTVLLGTSALALVGATAASAKVGVTSATDGDPLGKPIAEPERVLRIGIDVQANELITTNANDRAHLVFMDGTSLTVGPNARLTIDKFVYDPNTKTGDLAISASKGVFRLVGGKISKTSPITVTTPSSTIGIRGGITLFDVEAAETISTFVFGTDMVVSANGRTEIVRRPGSQVITNSGRAPGPPTLIPKGALNSQLGKLEGGATRGGTQGGGAGGTGRGNPDQLAQTSGFANQNSGQGPTGGQLSGTNFAPAPKIQPNQTTNALTNRNDALLQQLSAQTSQITTPTSQPPVPPAPPQIIVTRGRFLADPAYTNFNSQNLTVTPVPQNNVALAPTGTVTNSNATITLADGRSITVPWQPGGGTFALSLTDHTFGPLTGTGFVSPSGDYFAYSLKNANNGPLGFAGGTPTALAQFPTTGFAAHTMVSLAAGGQLPFASEAVGGDPQLRATASISPLYSVYSPNVVAPIGGPAPGPQSASAMQATISIAGQGASQKSYMGVLIADYAMDYNNNTVGSSGSFNATYRQGSNLRIGRQTSAESTVDVGTGNSIYGPAANAVVYTPDGAATTVATSGGVVVAGSTARAPQASFDQPYTDLNGASYYSVNAGIKTAAPATLGQTRSTKMISGYVGGLVEQRDSQGNFFTRTLGGNGAQPTDVAVTTDASVNRAAATITVAQWDGALASATFQLGGISGSRSATSSFVDDNIYALRDRPAGTLANTTSVTVNGNTSTGTDVQSRTSLVSYNTAPTAGLFQSAGVTPCTCEFLTWGWWGGDISYSAGSVYNAGGRDRLNLATYVAGTLSTAADLSTLNLQNATATYSGHMVGNVVNNGNAYVAAGTYTNQWSFGPRTGIATINFDGASFGGGLTANTAMSGGGPTFATTAPLASSVIPGRSLTLNGSFFSSPTDAAKYQAGNFGVTGTSYKAGGTFAGQK
jgi:hypothetical protein